MQELVINLSKTQYCTGLRCPKILWMDINKNEEYDPSMVNQNRINDGIKVGELARGYFGSYTLVPYSSDINSKIAETEQLINKKNPIICEAFFSGSDVFCIVDILRKLSSSFEIVEVKSSTSVKPEYLDDLAFQYYVLSLNGLNVEKATLMHINNKYERIGELEIQKLFNQVDCTSVVKRKQGEIFGNIKKIQNYISSKKEPDIPTGKHCNKPYPCPYTKYCFGNTIKRNNPSVSINRPAIKAFLETLSYPLYFLDFETFQEAIPSFDHQFPYQHIPCQYSLHIITKEGAEPSHREFLAAAGTDPRRIIAERLSIDIPKDVCVLTYYMSFEKSCISGLAGLFPDLASHLMSIYSNIKDLIIPFKQKAWHSDVQNNSNSIKAVLPAMFPDDPELDYSTLNLIHNGSEAMSAFLDIPNKNTEEQAIIRAALLAYCRLDTYAMVKILQKLEETLLVR